MLLESSIERHWVREAKKLGFYSIKFRDFSRRGAPDRLVLGHDGRLFFVEFKRGAGYDPTPHQVAYHVALRRRGFRVYVSRNEDDNFLILEKEK